MEPDKIGETSKQGDDSDPTIFEDVFPSESKGDGMIRPNNVKPGWSQGAASFKRKVRCQQCGFLVDIQKVDHSGGDYEAAGAGGGITTDGSALTPVVDAEGHTIYKEITGDPAEHTGVQAHRKGSGCPFCFSRNSSKVKIKDMPMVRPINKPGF